MAACRSAQRGQRTLLLEKQPRPGTKILMSGGTRCNLTHALDTRGFVEAFGNQGPFLHSAFAALGPEQLVDLVEAEGVATKIEPGGKIFPVSDRADDVVDALATRLRRSGCETDYGQAVNSIERAACGFAVTTTTQKHECEKLIVTCGGQSYPSSGSTGDGYAWARALGHTIVTPRPALVPITSHAPWITGLQGITLSDVSVAILVDEATHSSKKPLIQRRGSFLFAHFGATGPAVLNVSRVVSGHPHPRELIMRCDLRPDLPEAQLDAALQETCTAAGKRQLAGIVANYLPQRLADAVCDRANLRSEQRAAELSKPDRRRLIQTMKQFDAPISGTLGFNRAEVTAGGVALGEIDSRTMQSKVIPGLYFAGEILDIDGPIGGYNFQAAFSTGWLAGESA
jgi:predicted Rossmann fold flavoprotein